MYFYKKYIAQSLMQQGYVGQECVVNNEVCDELPTVVQQKGTYNHNLLISNY